MTYGGTSGTDSGRGVRQGNVRGYRPRGSGPSSRNRGLIVFLVICLVVVGAGLFLGMPIARSVAVGLADGNPSAINYPFVGGLIRDDLGSALTEPAGTDSTVVPFKVADGESVKEIGVALADANLIAKPMVFEYLVVSQDAADKLQTGTFGLNQTMTPPQIVDKLQQAPDPSASLVGVALRQGWRIEQIAAYLQTLDNLKMDVQQWYNEVQHPPADLIAAYPFLSNLPKDASLEGFLGTGVVYQVPIEATPDEFTRMLLDQWQKVMIDDPQSAGEQSVVDEAAAKKKDFYEVLTLASIVERETGDDSERAKIAGVYANRLKGLLGNKLLNADPTLIYANDTMKLRNTDFSDWNNYYFWSLLGISDLSNFQVSSDLQGYQTYVNQGLPPGPIDSPSKASIEAAISPDTSHGDVYFYACPTSKKHPLLFASTLAQQNANIAKCPSSN
jgi:UPF0755 protein